jgi:hypothetical protein
MRSSQAGRAEVRAVSLHHGNEKAAPCRVAAGPIEAGDEAKPDWVVAGNEDDRNRRRRRLGREPGDDAPGRGDNGYLTANHFQPFEIMLIAQ